MKIQLIGIFVFSLVMLTAISCEVGDPSEQPAEVVQKEGKIFIRDNTGKEWDVTHAVNVYGFNPGSFQFGLGPFAIRPILDPQMLDPRDPNYPSNSADFTVIGTTLMGDTRAYPLNVLTRHEIADEKFGDIHVAVAY